MIIEKLENNFFVIRTNKYDYFVSFEKMVAIYDLENKEYITYDFKPTATTKKHMNSINRGFRIVSKNEFDELANI